MTLKELLRIEGAPRIAETIGVSVSSVHRLSSGHLGRRLSSAVDIVLAMVAEFPDANPDYLLWVASEAVPNSDANTLWKIKEAYPQIDLLQHMEYMTQMRRRRKARPMETRGRKPSK